MNDRLNWLQDELAQLDKAHLRRRLRLREGTQSAVVGIDGREFVNFSSNDYLGLAADRRLADAAIAATRQEGWGSGASPLILGRSPAHERLERDLAHFEATERALLFPSGYAANVGVITALAGRGDTIFSDAKNHASIIDGCRLSRAHVIIYDHGDMDDLQAKLRAAGSSRRRLIVSDALFSMDGDTADVARLAQLADEHHAMLMLDEAHATGVMGPLGRGVCEGQGVDDRIDVRVGTLSKALGSVGGFAVGSTALVDWLINAARPYIFSTALPAACPAAASAALAIVQSEPERRIELLQRATIVRERLASQGWNTGRSQSQIIPVYVGDPQRTMQLATQLHEQGFLVPPIRPPSVPQGESLLRISLSSGHDEEMIERLLDALGKAEY